MEDILLGYEAGTGNAVNIQLKHAVFTGVTESGKTTAIETCLRQEIENGKTGLVFLTKKGEEEFKEGHKVDPYFRSNPGQKQDLSLYVQELLESYTGKNLGRAETAIIKIVDGQYENIEPADNVQEVRDNINQILELDSDEDSDVSLHPIVNNQFIKLAKYFERTLDPIEDAELTDTLELKEGQLNIMDLRDFEKELQSMIIERTLKKIYLDLKDIRVAIPEAWKFLPQKAGNICKDAVVQFIREGATNGNYLTIDAQDITRVDKEALKQMSQWVMGRQTEKNEVERTRDQVPAEKSNAPSKSEIMDLGVGFFWYCEATKGSGSARIQKVYVAPAWLEDTEWEGKKGEELAKAISKDEVDYEAFLQAIEDGEIDTGTEKIEREQVQKEQETMETEQDEDQLSEEVQKYKDRVENLQEKKKFLNQEIDELENELEQKENKISSLETRIESLEEKTGNDNPVEDEANSMVKDVVATGKTDSDEQTDDLEKKISNLENQIAEIRSQMLTTEKVREIVEEKIGEEDLVSKNWVEKRINDVESSGTSTRNLDSVREEIYAEFQEETINHILGMIDEFPDKQLKMLLWLEARGKSIGSRRAWFQKSLDKDRNPGSTESDYMNELIEEDFVRLDQGSNVHPETKDMVAEKLDDADQETIDETYNKLLAKMKDRLGEI